jgi:hypothetical protein
MKLKPIFLLIILVLALNLQGGNSMFSFYGLPCQNYGYDIYGISMGNVGISDIFRKNTGYANPAIMGAANRAFFSTGIIFGWTGYKSDGTEKTTYRDNSLDFPYFSVSLPVNNHHFGFQFNSMASGVVANQNTFTADSLTITEYNSIDRYIYKADILYAYHYHHINLGVGFNYYLGHEITRFSQDGGFGIFNTKETLSSTFKNPSATVGMTIGYENFAAGAYYSHSADLKGDKTRTSIHETEELGSAKFSVPAQIGAGFTAKLGNEYKASTEVVFSLWKDATYKDYPHNGIKIGLGIAQEPRPDSRKTFFGQMPKRIGISHRLLPFEVNNHTVSETALSSGITFPIKNSDNQLDFGIQYLVRGSLEQHNKQDSSLMFMIGITGFDILTKAFNRKAPRDIPVAEDID